MKKLKNLLLLFLNKGLAMVVLAILLFKFTGLADAPFSELVYALILVGTTIVIAPIIRFMVFPRASEMAEGDALGRLLVVDKVSPALIHYWVATVLSYLVTLVCVSSLL